MDLKNLPIIAIEIPVDTRAITCNKKGSCACGCGEATQGMGMGG